MCQSEVVENASENLKAHLCFDTRSFIISSLRSRSEGEALAWKERRHLGLPNYAHICKYEYHELKATLSSPALRQMLVICGMGHILTSVGRRAWYVVLWKYVRFLALCFGYWTDDVVEMFSVHDTMRDASLVWTHPSFKVDGATEETRPRDEAEETEAFWRLPETTLKNMYKEDYCKGLRSIVSTRATILQLVPGFALLAIFADFTSSYPFLVYSKELDLSLPASVFT